MHLDANKDKAVWKSKKDGIFSVKSFYDYLAKRDEDVMRFPALKIWKVKAPSRFFFFFLLLGKQVGKVSS